MAEDYGPKHRATSVLFITIVNLAAKHGSSCRLKLKDNDILLDVTKLPNVAVAAISLLAAQGVVQCFTTEVSGADVPRNAENTTRRTIYAATPSESSYENSAHHSFCL